MKPMLTHRSALDTALPPTRSLAGPGEPELATCLAGLARLDARGALVLSVYLDLDRGDFPSPGARGTQIRALLDQAHRRGADADAERISEWVREVPQVLRSAGGLGLFSCAGTGLLTGARLPAAVNPMVIVNSIPWLEPLAAAISPGHWRVAVVSRRDARLLRGDAAGLTEFARIHDDVHGRHSQGGWSQARWARAIEHHVADHVHRSADLLLRAHGFRRDHIVIVCSAQLRPQIDSALHPDLRPMLAGFVEADLEHAMPAEIAAAIGPTVEAFERARELELTQQIEQALALGGPAAAGVDEVLAALEERRVEVLFVPAADQLPAGQCPACGRLVADGARRCPVDGAALVEVDAIRHAVEAASRSAATIQIARSQAKWLRGHGQMAALLRW